MNRALICCINSYPGSPLRGCLNDAENIRQELINLGFDIMHIKVLREHQATRDGILNALEQLVSSAQKGDHLVFHFSGHGSQVPDQLFTGDGECDGMDEILCPYDFDWNGIYIRDDQIRSTVEGLHRGATLDIVLDCCHSGTGLRETDTIAKYIPYPGKLPDLIRPFSLDRGEEMPNVCLWAGCRSDQTSADAFIDNKYQGAFTWAFCDTFSQYNVGDFGFKTSYAARRGNLIKIIQRKLEQAGYDQIPQLECSDEMKNRGIFT